MNPETLDAVAGALRYARSICAEDGQPLPPVSLRDIEDAGPADSLPNVRLLQAWLVEAELLRLSSDLSTFVRRRALARLVDLGGLAALSDRTAGELDRLTRAHPRPSSLASRPSSTTHS